MIAGLHNFNAESVAKVVTAAEKVRAPLSGMLLNDLAFGELGCRRDRHSLAAK